MPENNAPDLDTANVEKTTEFLEQLITPQDLSDLQENQELSEEEGNIETAYQQACRKLTMTLSVVMREVAASSDPQLALEFQDLMGKYGKEIEQYTKATFEKTSLRNLLKRSPEELLSAVTTLETDENGEIWYEAHFPSEKTEEGIGLGDILSNSYQYVKVFTAQGEEILGYRAVVKFNGKDRVGYKNVSNGEYITIFTKDRFQAYESLPQEKTDDVAKKSFQVVTEESLDSNTPNWATIADLQENDENALLPEDSARESEVKNEYLSQFNTEDLVTEFFETRQENIDEYRKYLQEEFPNEVDQMEDVIRLIQERQEMLSNALALVQKFTNEKNNESREVPNRENLQAVLLDPKFPILTLRKQLGAERFAQLLRDAQLSKEKQRTEIVEAITQEVGKLGDGNAVLLVFETRENFIRHLVALAEKESGFHPFALSETYCMGPFQFTKSNTDRLHIANPFHPASAVQGVFALWEENVATIGPNCTPQQLVMAHFIGAGRVKSEDTQTRNAHHASNHESGEAYYLNFLKILAHV